MIKATSKEFNLFKDLIEDSCGIAFGDHKKYLIENRLSCLVKQHRCKTFSEFYCKIKTSHPICNLISVVIDAVTINETLWLRDKYPFRILLDRILPEYNQKRKKGEHSKLNIWSAACSTGQEPYSIAMTIDDFKRRYSEDLKASIVATDISATVLSKAIQGRYDDFIIRRGMNDHYLEFYFTKQGDEWVINDKIKNMVEFRELNLKEPVQDVIGPFDIIFLRNVIIYFADELKKQVYNRVASILSPGGYLFLGTGETVSGYVDNFHMIEDNGAIFYKLK